MKKKKFKIVGLDVEGRSVIDGSEIYKFHETYGLPLGMIIHIIFKKNLNISWLHFYEYISKIGCDVDKILSELKFDLILEKGEEYSNPVIDILIEINSSELYKNRLYYLMDKFKKYE